MLPQPQPFSPRPSRAPDHLRAPDRAHRRAGEATEGRLLGLRRPPATPARGLAGDLRVASYNLHKCVGTDRRFDPARSAAVIAELGADLVAVQEADRRFGRRVGLLDLEALARDAGLVPLPASDLPDGHGWHGNALLVRPGTPARLRRLRLPGAEPRGALLAELELPAGRLRVVAAHLGLLRRHRTRQAAAILRALAEGEAMPTLLLGDLNEWRPGARSSLRTFEPLFGPLAPSPPSFPARLPVLALDRILGWPQGLVSEVAVHDSPLARLASDHLPVTARVRLGVVAGAAPESLPLAAAA
ncbi:endonuclease/exonuclease/phosphatase family protein [Caldovatus aquaticus]|uniref:Endonuclease/exonuclease/phosphatase family protein n=1 Tax=Caldovatus aquaticus TaxID=2865671 RepID=A0ABS7EXY0_9PROT|nr:endonuclease/exonuclease/phosphatase family protein [Caldovatus aquaticus]MBW8268220.1 endonuclease/exonuclease/phosphatase family protein [Caldovatus aquaticus]